MEKQQEQKKTLRSKPRSLRHLDPLHPVSSPTNKSSSRKMLERSKNIAIQPKRFKQSHPADNRNEGPKQGNVTHSGHISILKNPFN